MESDIGSPVSMQGDEDGDDKEDERRTLKRPSTATASIVMKAMADGQYTEFGEDVGKVGEDDDLERLTLSDSPRGAKWGKGKEIEWMNEGMELSSSVSHEDAQKNVFNPFQLRTKESLVVRTEKVMQSLSFHALEMSVEAQGIGSSGGAGGLWNDGQCFLGLFERGLKKEEWSLLDKSEKQVCGLQVRFLKKFRLRAATEMDRHEKLVLTMFSGNDGGKNMDKKLKAKNGMGYVEFTVDDLLSETQMMTETQLKIGKGKAVLKDATLMMALEMVYHIENERTITFDLGFLDTATVRNRMCFILSRALRRGKWSPVYRSENRVRGDFERFDLAIMKEQQFHGGDLTRLFRIEIHRAYKNGKTKLLGFMQTSVQKMARMEANSQLYWWPAREGIRGAKAMIQYIDASPTAFYFSLRIAGQK